MCVIVAACADHRSSRREPRALTRTAGRAGRWGHERLMGGRAIRALLLERPRAPHWLRPGMPHPREGHRLELINFRRMVFCGVDWAEDHHDVAIIDASGALLAKARIDDDATGLAQLLALLAEHGRSCEVPIPVAIETTRGLLVACLRATRRRVCAINPLAVARYRERHSVARKKGDAIGAAPLANRRRTAIP